MSDPTPVLFRSRFVRPLVLLATLSLTTLSTTLARFEDPEPLWTPEQVTQQVLGDAAQDARRAALLDQPFTSGHLLLEDVVTCQQHPFTTLADHFPPYGLGTLAGSMPAAPACFIA
ncbi:hypothetical protein [Deinococcus sonorensis]|uniref:Uncharacterized protein n=1 Tax=Deinococcus sonorensis TaxID=309891 RepID=A0ABV8YBC1_9DEIO